MRNLTIEEKVLVFKYLAISKIVHMSLITTVPQSIIDQLNKELYMDRKNPKMKYSTLSNSYEDGGLKDVDVFTNVISL